MFKLMGKIMINHIFTQIKFPYLDLCLSLLVGTCPLLITFANSLDPDQDRQKIITIFSTKTFYLPVDLYLDIE